MIEAGYYQVDEFPVQVIGEGEALQCSQWSSGRPRALAIERVLKRGKRITEAQWRDLINAWRLGY